MRFKIIKEVSISFIKHHRGYAFFPHIRSSNNNEDAI